MLRSLCFRVYKNQKIEWTENQWYYLDLPEICICRTNATLKSRESGEYRVRPTFFPGIETTKPISWWELINDNFETGILHEKLLGTRIIGVPYTFWSFTSRNSIWLSWQIAEKKQSWLWQEEKSKLCQDLFSGGTDFTRILRQLVEGEFYWLQPPLIFLCWLRGEEATNNCKGQSTGVLSTENLIFNHKNISLSFLKKLQMFFLLWLCSFTFPSTVHKCSPFSAFLPTLSYCFDTSHSGRCEVIHHCGFDLHFPDG